MLVGGGPHNPRRQEVQQVRHSPHYSEHYQKYIQIVLFLSDAMLISGLWMHLNEIFQLWQ